MALKLTLVLAFALLINIPFGVWRAGLKKFTMAWWLAIHLPVPLVIALRIGLDIPYASVPFVIAAAVAGQWFGGRLRKKPAPVSAD